MDLVNKINKSRSLLKKYLESEWDISTISDYSNQEIEKLYNLKVSKNEDLYFGKATNLNITLNHKQIKDHKLHIIYYNFPELNSPNMKVTKTCADKMNKLYLEEIINPEDSIILIITENITENLEKCIEDIYKNGQEYLANNNLSDNILTQNEALGDSKYNLTYFRNIHLFRINNLSFDISSHFTVPEHKCIRNNKDKNSIRKKTNSSDNQLPVILRTDPMAKLLRMCPGDMCEITRNSERCGEYKYYRICQ
jgi:DNA-directed RNA polymerase subunit H (RpoH/RPB5)|tara:strand:- start:623 stop:1378 length:756 start_codon:yes stop_codon:yes gene_type:complete